MILILKFLTRVMNYLKLIFSIISLLKHIKLVLGSVKFFKKLKQKKKSDTAIILSGYRTENIALSEKDLEFDILTNSSGADALKNLRYKNYLLHYQAPQHKRIDKQIYIDRVNKIQANLKPKEVLGIYHWFWPLEIPVAYWLPFKWPFLKPYNGPAALIWLAYCLGYKKIILYGVEGTQMCGSKMNYDERISTYDTSIDYLAFSTARMVLEYNYIFDKINKKEIKVTQSSKTSWIQSEQSKRIVVDIDDSWSVNN